MQTRKVIQRRIRHAASGVDLASDINAVVSANVGERKPTPARGRTTAERRAADEGKENNG
jgi:hypothetical protein